MVQARGPINIAAYLDVERDWEEANVEPRRLERVGISSQGGEIQAGSDFERHGGCVAATRRMDTRLGELHNF